MSQYLAKMNRLVEVFNAVVVALVVSLAFMGTAFGEHHLDEYKNFVQKVQNNITSVLVHENFSQSERKEKVLAILRSSIDSRDLGKFTLARHWNKASDSQREKYLILFEESLVDSIIQLKPFGQSSKDFSISGSRLTKDGSVIVSSNILYSSKYRFHVDWRVIKTKRGIFIADIITNGVSFGIAQRSVYSSLVKDHGGIDGLLEVMKSRPVGLFVHRSLACTLMPRILV